MSPFISRELQAANPPDVKPRGDDGHKTGRRKGGAFVMAYMQIDHMCGRIKEEDERRFFLPHFPRDTKEEKKEKAKEAPGEP